MSQQFHLKNYIGIVGHYIQLFSYIEDLQTAFQILSKILKFLYLVGCSEMTLRRLLHGFQIL